MTPAEVDTGCPPAGSAPGARRGLSLHNRPNGIAGYTAAFVWLVFIAFPAVDAFTRRGSALNRGLTIAGAAGFILAYIAMVLAFRQRYADRILPALFVLLVAIASALTLSDGGGWGFLFTYCAACASLISRRYGFAGVILCSVLAGVTSVAGGGSAGNAIGWVASSAGIGMLLLVMRDLRIRNDQLSQARAELARMAVAEERERFARDLHDLLGHSLSLIALKSELASRLLHERPDDAARELTDVETVARQALGEVRDAVSGYRRPTLEGELRGAQTALAAAGIRADVQRADVALDPDAEAVLAWTVREGVTNVIRHSQATACGVSITVGATQAAVEVIDDGVGAASANGHAGSGLAGLAQRAQDIGGTLVAGALTDGGFRLSVTAPARLP